MNRLFSLGFESHYYIDYKLDYYIFKIDFLTDDNQSNINKLSE